MAKIEVHGRQVAHHVAQLPSEPGEHDQVSVGYTCDLEDPGWSGWLVFAIGLGIIIAMFTLVVTAGLVLVESL